MYNNDYYYNYCQCHCTTTTPATTTTTATTSSQMLQCLASDVDVLFELLAHKRINCGKQQVASSVGRAPLRVPTSQHAASNTVRKINADARPQLAQRDTC